LLEAVAQQLEKSAGAAVPRDAFDPQAIPDHLRMNFRVIDPGGKVLAIGRDLAAVRRQLGVVARETFAALPRTAQYHRDGIRNWDFGEALPLSVQVQRQGMTLQGYPALVEQAASVGLRLLDSAQAAQAAHRAGVRRLFMIELRGEFDYVARNLSSFHQMALHYATIGTPAELKAALLLLIADRAFHGDQPADVRTRAEFARRSEAGWKRLNAVADQTCALVGQILSAYQPVLRQLCSPAPPAWNAAIADLQEQMRYLMFKGVLLHTPWTWLQQYPRYLKAMSARLSKLSDAGLARDEQNMAIIRPMWKQYLERLSSHRERGISDGQLGLYRWMVEEMRVSLFAQELKTAIPVSTKRLADQWARVRP
jgi:ATP-dependent helicase HrpA